jgi:SAM-dependent methyltransferase
MHDYLQTRQIMAPGASRAERSVAFFQRVGQTVRRKIVRASYSIGTGKKCYLCGWRGRKFAEVIYPEKPAPALICPRCSSHERHRLAYYLLHDRLGTGHRTLHVAPEKEIERWLRGISTDYLSVDLSNCAMRKMSLTDLDLADNSFSLIWCSHVLEHIPDDRKAMSEIFRVLKPDGLAVIAVPIYGEKTYEDWTIASPQERRIHFKQDDHVRLYARDITTRLKNACFHTEVLDISTVPRADVERCALDYPSTREIFLCTKEGL